MNPYEKLLARKRTWTPVQCTDGPLTPGAEAAIRRALSMRHMELPVGDFVRDALEKEVPESARRLLESNIQDEVKHDLALNYCADAIGVDEKDEAEAKRLRQAWIDHPDHTLMKALIAERAIFFVLLPFFRFCGNAGLREAAQSISRDEQVHVACGSIITRELGLSVSSSLDLLRKATINWVFEPLTANTPNKYINKKFWLESSDRLMYEGKAPGLQETKAGRFIAFFEHNARNLPQYN